MNAPTDRKILEAIYEQYYEEFASFDEAHPSRSSKIFVPLDLTALAQKLGVDPDIVFGRLYYDLENRYGYRTGDQSRVTLFGIKVGGERHVINFPYMASILAGLRDDQRRHTTATTIASFSAAIAVCALIVSIVSLFRIA